MQFPKNLENFIKAFSKLPGIGVKTSERLGFYLLTKPLEYTENLSNAIKYLKEKTGTCETCGALSDQEDCPICSNSMRDRSVICVVENPADIYYIESTRTFNGLYHVLGGVISPLNGVTPNDLTIEGLLKRTRDTELKELIFATSPTTEGDTTVLYIKEMLVERLIKITHLARGIPVGTGLQYAGSGSLSQAIKNREEIK